MLDRIAFRSKNGGGTNPIKDKVPNKPSERLYGNSIKGKLVFTKHLDSLNINK